MEIIYSCEQRGLVPLPSYLSKKKKFYEDKSMYKDTEGRICVTKELLAREPAPRNREDVLNDALKLIEEQQKKMDKKDFEINEHIDGKPTPMQKHCTSKTTVGQCPINECQAFVDESDGEAERI